jgi:HD-GYP domain-containing protein (c-di-GMP phosphodiesterase class II)
MRLARRLGFSTEEIRNVGIGGLFHDVGKLALSDRIFTNRETGLPLIFSRKCAATR